MRVQLMTATMTAMAIAGTITANAQTPQTPQYPPQPRTEQARPAPETSAQVITITGCVQPESSVPGRKPNVAERAGVTEDYILTNVKMSPASAVSGIGLSSMYEIEGIAGSELKKHINHQIEVTGTVDPDRKVSDDAPNFHAVSMKMVAATCTPPEKGF